MASPQEQLKWEGKLTAKVSGPTADQVWSLLEDFCNLHKWIPTVDTCYHVEGVNGEPGLIRYCASAVPSSEEVHWCHEKLLAIDPTEKSLSYNVLDNNIGITSYEATMKVLPAITSDAEEVKRQGCLIEWSYAAEPIEGFTFEAFSAFLDLSLRGMVERMEKAFQSE